MNERRVVHRAWQLAPSDGHRNAIKLVLLIEEPTSATWVVETVAISAGGSTTRLTITRNGRREPAEQTYEELRLSELVHGGLPTEGLDPIAVAHVGGDEDLITDHVIGVVAPQPALVAIEHGRRLRGTPSQATYRSQPDGVRLLLSLNRRGMSVTGYGEQPVDKVDAARRSAHSALADATRIWKTDPPSLLFDATWCDGRLVLTDLLAYDVDVRMRPFAERRSLLGQAVAESFFAESAVEMLSDAPDGDLFIDVSAAYGQGAVRVAA